MLLQANYQSQRPTSRFSRAPGTPVGLSPPSRRSSTSPDSTDVVSQADSPIGSLFSNEAASSWPFGERPQLSSMQHLMHMFSAMNGSRSPSDHVFDKQESLVRKDHFSFTLNTCNSANQQFVQPKKSVKYSRKVFVGGLPVDVPMDEIGPMFSQFGRVFVDWPQRPEQGRRVTGSAAFGQHRHSPGYVFLVFEEESSVEKLLKACYKHGSNGHFLLISSSTVTNKRVQVRPWLIEDGVYAPDKMHLIEDRATVFIGGVPRPTKAKDLAIVFENCFGPGSVLFCSIDMDPELDYPKGAARVTFKNERLAMNALKRHFVELPYMGTTKRVEIKPYLIDEQHCDQCEGVMSGGRSAPYFCADHLCYQYYCEHCWDVVHYNEKNKSRRDHVVLVRRGDGAQLFMKPPHHYETGNYMSKKTNKP